jgi:hypothetical protein
MRTCNGMRSKGQRDGIYKESAVICGHSRKVVKEINNTKTAHGGCEQRVTSKISIL